MNVEHQVQERIDFLEKQLESLDHYLPETYQYLMSELDQQQRNLMEIRIQRFYGEQKNEQ